MFRVFSFKNVVAILAFLVLTACLSQGHETVRKTADFNLSDNAKDKKIRQFINNEYFKKLPLETQLKIVEKLKGLKTEEEIDFYFSKSDLDNDPRTYLENFMTSGINTLNSLEQNINEEDKPDKSAEPKPVLEILQRTTVSINDKPIDPKNRRRGIDSTKNYIFDSYGNYNQDLGVILLIKANPRWLDPKSYFSGTLDGKTLGASGAAELQNQGFIHVSGSHQVFLTGYYNEDLYLTSNYKNHDTNTYSQLSYFIYGISVWVYHNSWSKVTSWFGGRTDYTQHDVMPIIYAPTNAALTNLKFLRTKNFDARYYGKTIGYVYKSGILQNPDDFNLNHISHGDVLIEVSARADKGSTLKGVLDFTETGIIGLKDEPFKTKVRWEGKVHIRDNSWPVDKTSHNFKDNNNPYEASIDKYNVPGKVHLNFFGPLAEEVGGTFNFILEDTSKYIKELSRTERVLWSVFNGSFGAKR